MNIMITKGLKGRTNLEQYHTRCEEVVKDYFNDVEVVFTSDVVEFKHIENFDYTNYKHRLKALINTLDGEVTIADEVVFMDDWYNFAGCRIEHQICVEYDIPIVYLNSNFY